MNRGYTKMTIIKYKTGELKRKGGIVFLSENVVFVEIGGSLDDEQALQDWLQELGI